MTTEGQVAQIVARITKLPAARILADTHLKNELNVDSLQGLQILAAIEKQFHVSVPDDELDRYTTVREIVETIERNQPQGPRE
jgi:acyl carrier protein